MLLYGPSPFFINLEWNWVLRSCTTSNESFSAIFSFWTCKKEPWMRKNKSFFCADNLHWTTKCFQFKCIPTIVDEKWWQLFFVCPPHSSQKLLFVEKMQPIIQFSLLQYFCAHTFEYYNISSWIKYARTSPTGMQTLRIVKWFTGSKCMLLVHRWILFVSVNVCKW